MKRPARKSGSYYWDQVTCKGPLRGCLRMAGRVIWSCSHQHSTAAAARACAREHLLASPEIGLDR